MSKTADETYKKDAAALVRLGRKPLRGDTVKEQTTGNDVFGSSQPTPFR